MYRFRSIIIAFMLLGSVITARPARAHTAHDDFVHLTAHVGASFALQTVFYGINHRGLKMNRFTAQTLAVVETLAIGYLYKLSENAGPAETRVSMQRNALGVGLAIGTHVVLRF